MSLIKQLWIALLITVTLASVGSFVLSTLSSKSYLEEQLQTQNIDNVTSLALSMSQHKKDPVLLSLLLSAQFDSGHYRYIRLFNSNGKLFSERVGADTISKAPLWFIKLVPIHVLPGVANVQNGWQQYGSIILESDVNFAYEKLWDSTLIMSIWILLISVLVCYVGGKLLSKILAPLDDVVNQAKAIGENKFINITEPKTLEFKAVVREMNKLSNHIKLTVTKESIRLGELHYKNNFDELTGLMNSDFFMNSLEATTKREDYSEGSLIILRLCNLTHLNKVLGYPKTNGLLKNISSALEIQCAEDLSLIACRLNGTEFAVFCKQNTDEFKLAKKLKYTVENSLKIEMSELAARVLVVATRAKKTDETAILFKTLNSVLNNANSNEENYLRIVNANDLVVDGNNMLGDWKSQLDDAINKKQIKLEHFPVVTAKGVLIHYESPVRLQLNGKWLCAGEFIQWAIELNLIKAVDELVLETAVMLVAQGGKPLCINVSGKTMCDRQYCDKALKLIKQHLQDPSQLSFEVPELAVFDQLDEFKYFCNQLKSAGCLVGVEHVGLRISRLGELYDIGLNYIKFDASIIRGIDTNKTNTALLRGLCIVAHSLGIQAIAEGINNNEEVESLINIGVDGLTGPGISL